MTLYKPETYPTFETAKFIVGSNGDEVERLFLDKKTTVESGSAHLYLDFFDAEGLRIDSVKVIKDENGKTLYNDKF